MASYSDALKFEAEAPANTVRLIKSGEFYRAYNHSAWLFQCCIAEYRVMRKYIKSLKSDVYYIGFPEKSLFSNIGERRSSKTDMGFDIELHEEEVPDESGFEVWKMTVETQHSSKGDYNSLPLFSIDDCRESVPAAGWRYGTSLNNAGDNGNYWSSTPNGSNTLNAYNLNFNSGNHNVDWNNRNNGQSVRPVSELTSESKSDRSVRHFSITKEQLLLDICQAYRDARRHKRKRAYQLKFEFNLEDNLVNLRDELYAGTYRPGPSSCFIIHEPKMREVFAAEFRDRIVHHLFYNYTHRIFERTFIYDSYSCIEGRGTHFGIDRLRHHIVSESAGYTRPCYVLRIDISGYFMSIDRKILLQLCREILLKKKSELADYEFTDYLLETIVCANPVENCRLIGKWDEWKNLPQEKSLFFSSSDCGLPIGNLSSQLFSNVYLNKLDQYVKRVLKCRHYGRYVDDVYVVSEDGDYLKSLIPAISDYLGKQLKLRIHPAKTRVFNAYYGVEFLGAYIKPFRTYVSSSSLVRIKRGLAPYRQEDIRYIVSSVNSYLGVLSHYDTYCLRRVLLGYLSGLNRLGSFSLDWLVFTPHALYLI